MAEAVAVKARQDVWMNVKDFLSGNFAVCQEKVDAVRPRPALGRNVGQRPIDAVPP